MKISSDLKLVSVSSITRGEDCPLGDLPELYKLALSMQIICEKEKGIGLSAVQVGAGLKFYIINYLHINKSDFRHFVNCDYKKIDDEQTDSLESCLSIRGNDGSLRYFQVKRFKRVTVSGKELVLENGCLILKDILFECEAVEAVVHQHEADHANQILISDIGKEYAIW